MRSSDWSSDVCSSDLGVLFTIEANSTKNRVIETSLMRLRMSGAKLFGAIVTKVSAKNNAYGCGYGYGYGYTYGTERKSVVSGQSVSGSVDIGGRRYNKKKRNKNSDKRQVTVGK